MRITMTSEFPQMYHNISNLFMSAMPRIRKKLTQNLPKYRQQAQEITRAIHYNTPEGNYRRTEDLLRSVDARFTENDEVFVFHNPARGVRNVRFPFLQSYAYRYKRSAQAGYTYYPAFVRQDNFFGKSMGRQDHVEVWKKELLKTIKQDIRDA